MPFAGEVGLVAGLFEDRPEGPLGRRQPAALALERDRRHAAAVRDAARLHRRTARRAAGLRIEGREHHAFRGELVKIGGRHAPVVAAEIGAQIPVADIVADDQQDVGLGRILRRDGRCPRQTGGERER
jgi:hypothetical protein